jgi:hypothetical protein
MVYSISSAHLMVGWLIGYTLDSNPTGPSHKLDSNTIESSGVSILVMIPWVILAMKESVLKVVVDITRTPQIF